jgi:hypothetical protein
MFKKQSLHFIPFILSGFLLNEVSKYHLLSVRISNCNCTQITDMDRNLKTGLRTMVMN